MKLVYRFGLTCILIMCVCLSGCTSLRPYKMGIQQGNILEEDKINQLAVGMSPREVKSLLGTPLLQDRFTSNRWDYLYYDKPAYTEAQIQQLVLYFKNDELAKIDKQLLQAHPVVSG